MAHDELVNVENLSKKFCRSLRQSLWYGVRDLAKEVIPSFQRGEDLRTGEFWALQDVSFTVRRGEMLGLIGQNGAGKSTLLKMLSGLMKPDRGEISIRGNVQGLIELGAGFNPVLTGRENIYVNAAILGITKAEVDQALPQIIDFAEIPEFMDSPVHSYSSGMKARLGFAVVTQLDPDVLLIDEVLAVGDMAFQEKCMRRMDVLRKSDKAIIFVTHSLYQVEALCTKALWLEAGRVVRYGDASDVVRVYLDDQERRAIAASKAEGVEYEARGTAVTKAYFERRDLEKRIVSAAKSTSDSEPIEIYKIELLDGHCEVRLEFPFQSDLRVRIHYNAPRAVYRPLFNLRFFHQGRDLFETSMLVDGYGPEAIEGKGVVECLIPKLPLTPKVYEIVLFVRSGEGIADITRMRPVAQFRVTDEGLDRVPLSGPMAVNHMRQGSPMYVPRTWRFYGSQSELLSSTNEGVHQYEFK